MRRMLKSLIADLATGIAECSDGSDAVASYAQQQPDWVLMDLELPGLDGLSATRQIKELWPSAQILIVTSYDEPELRRAASAAGACGYVLKENLIELTQYLQRDADGSLP